MKQINNEIHINPSCNLCCIYCKEKDEQPERSTNEVFSILEETSNYFTYCTLSGGEPTLNKDFFKILEYSLKLFDSVEIVTNGIRFKEDYFSEKFKDIAKLHSNRISLIASFDSIDENVDRILTSRSLLKERIKGLYNIKEIKHLKDFVVSIVVNNLSLLHINNSLEFLLKEIKPDYIFFQNFNPKGNDKNIISVLYDESFTIADKLKNLNKENFVYSSFPLCKLDNYENSIDYMDLLSPENKVGFFSQFKNAYLNIDCKSCKLVNYCPGFFDTKDSKTWELNL